MARMNRLGALLALAIVFSSPSLPAYQAAAQVMGANALAPRAVSMWAPVVDRAAVGLQAQPGAASPGLVNALGQARLQLTIDPRSAIAVDFVRHLPAEAATPDMFARLSPARQTEVLEAAVKRTSEDLSSEADALVKRHADPSAPWSRQDGRRLRELASVSFYLPSSQAETIRIIEAQLRARKGLGAAVRIAQTLSGVFASEEKIDPAVKAELRNLFKGAESLAQRHYGQDSWVRIKLAPYAAETMDQAERRLDQRGIPAWKLSAAILANHEQVFDTFAGDKLVGLMRRPGDWTPFVAALSLDAARRLANVFDPKALEILRKAGAMHDMRMAIPDWHPLAGQYESVAQSLSSRYGAPSETPLGKGIRLPKLFGIPIVVRYSTFASIAANALFIAGWSLSPVKLALGAAVMTLTYVSVLAHELDHALTFHFFGGRAQRIAVNMFGGGATVEWFRRALPDFLIAFAGPSTTLLIAAAFFLPGFLFPAILLHWPLLSAVLTGAFRVNLTIAAMNFLPILPLDGGNMFRAILSVLLGDDYRASRWNRRLSLAVGAALMVSVPVIYLQFGQWAFVALYISIMALLTSRLASLNTGTTLIPDASAKPRR